MHLAEAMVAPPLRGHLLSWAGAKARNFPKKKLSLNVTHCNACQAPRQGSHGISFRASF